VAYWYRFYPQSLEDPAFEALDPRHCWAFLLIVKELHKTYPQRNWQVTRRVMAAAGLGRHAKATTEALVKAGLLIPGNDAEYHLCERWRLHGGAPSTQRTRRYRTTSGVRQAYVSGQPADDSFVEPVEDAGIGNAPYIDKKNILDDCSDLGSPELVRNTPFASPPKSGEVGPEQAEPDEFDAFTQSQPAAFALTSPSSSNGANNGAGVASLFAHWQSLPHVQRHRRIEPHKAALEAAIKRFGYNSLKLAFDRWDIIRGDDITFWSWDAALWVLLSRKQGHWIDCLISDQWRVLFARRSQHASGSLDAHYARLLKQAGNA
jgi:hypothetical protein